ncbi:MAG: YbaK/EbsC family protein [Lautropia sp.]
MSLESVIEFLRVRAPDLEVERVSTSTATVALAARAHDVAPDCIAKTLSLRLRDEVILVVLSGESRLDNRKFKAHFGEKARMLEADAVLDATGHPVGGVCPFGLARPLRVFADRSIERHPEVLPAAGSIDAAVRIAPARLVVLVDAQWVDVALPGQTDAA